MTRDSEQKLNIEFLKKLGFRKVGKWKKSPIIDIDEELLEELQNEAPEGAKTKSIANFFKKGNLNKNWDKNLADYIKIEYAEAKEPKVTKFFFNAKKDNLKEEILKKLYELYNSNMLLHSCGELPNEEAVYAFVCGDKIKYIGKATYEKGYCGSRFKGYIRPSEPQQTNKRCNSEIKELIKRGKEVEIYICTTDRPEYTQYTHRYEYKDLLTITLISSLEEGLVKMLKKEDDCCWNWTAKQAKKKFSK